MRPADHPPVMWLTLGGGLFLLSAAVVLIGALSGAARAREAQCRAYLALLQQIRGQIACYHRPFSAICRLLDPQLYAACGLGMPGDSFSAMLDAAVLTLPPEAESLLRGFAAELGKSYMDEQLSACDEAIARMRAICEEETRRLPDRLRLIRAAGICGALALILLFL